MNKNVFEPSYNDLKFMVWNRNYVCTNWIDKALTFMFYPCCMIVWNLFCYFDLICLIQESEIESYFAWGITKQNEQVPEIEDLKFSSF